MTMKKAAKRSSVALAVLAMLYEAPMHPYRMQQLIIERGKDEVINVTQRASQAVLTAAVELGALSRSHTACPASVGDRENIRCFAVRHLNGAIHITRAVCFASVGARGEVCTAAN